MKMTLFLLIAACLATAHLTQAVDYGVGFELTFDYGVASVHFVNGSGVDIAKIEGGPAFKQTMRMAATWRHSGLEQPSIFDQVPVRLQSFRDYLPPWLGVRDDRAQSLFRMLDALKTASESYLETPLTTAVVDSPFQVTDLYLDALRSASSSLSLDLSAPTYYGPGVLTAQALGIGGVCHNENGEDDPEQYILIVHYSRAALTLNLLKEECEVFESWRELYNSSLGAGTLFNQDDLPGSRSSRDELSHALRELNRPPFELGGSRAAPEDIRQLVLIGESADDERLHDALKATLPEHFGFPFASKSETRSNVSSPTFLASRGAAMYSLSKIGMTERWNNAP